MLRITVNTFENTGTKFHNDQRNTIGHMYIYFREGLAFVELLINWEFTQNANVMVLHQKHSRWIIFVIFPANSPSEFRLEWTPKEIKYNADLTGSGYIIPSEFYLILLSCCSWSWKIQEVQVKKVVLEKPVKIMEVWPKIKWSWNPNCP